MSERIVVMPEDQLRQIIREELDRLRPESAAAPVSLSTDEAAAKCGRAEKTVREWCRAGELPARKTSRGWRIRLEDLERYLAGDAASEVAAHSVLGRVG